MSEEKQPIKSIVTPSRLEYDFTPGIATTRFLRHMAEGRIIGQRCSECTKVYIPARGSCPRCGVVTEEEVEVGPNGTVTTFCVVRVPSENIDLTLPYTAAHILLDGADTAMLHAVDAGDESKMSTDMRVVPRWSDKPTGSILDLACFEPEEGR